MKSRKNKACSFLMVCIMFFSLVPGDVLALEENPEEILVISSEAPTDELSDGETMAVIEMTEWPETESDENIVEATESLPEESLPGESLPEESLPEESLLEEGLLEEKNVTEEPEEVPVGIPGNDDAVENEETPKEDILSERWSELTKNGSIYIQSDGTLAFQESVEMEEPLYPQLATMLDIFNDGIESGTFVAQYTDNGIELVSTLTDEQQQMVLENLERIDGGVEVMSTGNSPHGCGHEYIDFRQMCRNNYKTIKDVFTGIASSNWGNAYTAAVTFWVGKVAEGCEWDYKSREEYGPYDTVFCSYYDGGYHDITSEYMGNYNYGYTGSFLFTLDMLFEGSFVVSKFRLSDVYADWPSICAGYNAAQSEQSNIHPKGVWIKFNAHYYYFDADGTMATGWFLYDGNWYYFSSTGEMQTGWVKSNGKYYYMDSSGVMQTGWQKVDRYWYYLNSSGVMQTGWQQIGETYYHLESSGKWSGWIIYGNYYYYRYPSSGEIYTDGWLKYNGAWYYLNTSTGKVVTGWLYYNGNYYYLSPSTGKMVTGWLKYNTYWYYMDSSGKMLVSEWVKYNNYWYYLKSTGKMACSETLLINNVSYTFDSSGRWIE